MFHQTFPQDLRHIIWILAIRNNIPITEKQVKLDSTTLQHATAILDPVIFEITKQISGNTPSVFQKIGQYSTV